MTIRSSSMETRLRKDNRSVVLFITLSQLLTPATPLVRQGVLATVVLDYFQKNQIQSDCLDRIPNKEGLSDVNNSVISAGVLIFARYLLSPYLTVSFVL